MANDLQQSKERMLRCQGNFSPGQKRYPQRHLSLSLSLSLSPALSLSLLDKECVYVLPIISFLCMCT